MIIITRNENLVRTIVSYPTPNSTNTRDRLNLWNPMIQVEMWLVFVVLLFACSADADVRGDVYDIGVGIADVTGPCTEVPFVGYTNFQQKGSGIHTRLFSRAFIFGDGSGKRSVFVSVEAGMMTQLVKNKVAKRLRELYNDLYTEENVCLSSTHTHSGPGGYFQYLIYQIPSLGFVNESMTALVEGIILSIQRAHENIQQGYIFYNKGVLLNASVNRSPSAYLENPPKERAKYHYDVDKEMHLLKLTDLAGTPIGMVNWFAVHGVSMNKTNTLVSSDNKGYASILFENHMEPESLLGKTKFVAAFAQANVGDVSPNILGPHCIDNGEPCDYHKSTCDGNVAKCIAFGPGKDMFESTSIIAHRQFYKAVELFNSATTPIKGPINFVHQSILMPHRKVKLNDTTEVSTCSAAFGISFGAGTTDGTGEFPFNQNSKDKFSPVWSLVNKYISTPSLDLITCQKPKPIFLPSGEVNVPYPWTPSVVETQILQIGNFFIVAVPGEFTTMSGRRLRKAVKKIVSSSGTETVHVVIAGLSNSYTSYITTFEEYEVQRYEGASTLYGPHTLAAYIQQYVYLANNLKQNETLPPGPESPDPPSWMISLLPPIVAETSPFWKNFGSVYKDAEPNYSRGSLVEIGFICGNPRNDLMLEKSFLTVELYDEDSDNWTVIATDANWETKFHWEYSNILLHQSQCQVVWEIPKKAISGKYIIRHRGFHRRLIRGITPYEGSSRPFKVI